ncbi:tRNA lysidine(34) synthetase TilS [Candidatus Karelsulcia muelleri]|uniref:tRNA lysidine(34) synthetase TilS n=1 Tax=Candidatus Karelsulcia muelleri TaxID=336810 RepID=UPI00293D42E5|nr:tRNA lysidine(34) synthetase TilS [Candidatus Karelsulcia muelleri]
MFPLQLRNCKKGDIFHPIGMKGYKKLCKYFKDKKISIVDKKQIWILINGDKKIIWIISERLDKTFKVTNLTKNILNLKFVPIL